MDRDWPAEQCEESPRLTVEYRVLGSLTAADGAARESWLLHSRSDTSGVENLGVTSPGFIASYV